MPKTLSLTSALCVLVLSLCCLGMPHSMAANEGEMSMLHHDAAHSCCPDSTEDVSNQPETSCHSTVAPDSAMAGVSLPSFDLVAVAPAPHASRTSLTLGAQPIPTVARAPPDLLAQTALHLIAKQTVVLRA